MKLSRTKTILIATSSLLVAGGVTAGVVGFRPTHHETTPSKLGTVSSTAELEAVLDQPTDVTVETIVSVDWEIERSGVLNLDSPKAKEAGLVDGPEPIQVFFHAVHHPTRGLYLIDSGVEKALLDDPEHAAIRGPIAAFLHTEKMKRGTDTATWIAAQKEPVRGVFLTHLHTDHVSGLPDVPKDAEIFAAEGETTERTVLNIFVSGSVDRALASHGPIQEWHYEADPSGVFLGVLDVFGDKTVFALHVPGHTAGSTAYLVRSTKGPVLFTGDACHTAWGWEHGVEPGTFSRDKAASRASLEVLRAFVAKHPEIDVRLGHQTLKAQQSLELSLSDLRSDMAKAATN